MRVSYFGFALAALAAGATPCSAQGLVPAAGLSIVSARVRGTDQLTGTVVGGQGSVALGRLELALGYVQGKIEPPQRHAALSAHDRAGQLVRAAWRWGGSSSRSATCRARSAPKGPARAGRTWWKVSRCSVSGPRRGSESR